MALYFKTCPTTIADDRINDYLLLLQEKKNPSASYFKHTVYGLRLAFRLIDREDRAIRLPSIRRSKSLPVILNRKEVKALIGAPKWKKHRILIALIYSAGLRVREVSQLEQRDIDFERMTIHIRKTKYNKDRIIPLARFIKKGLIDYYKELRPKKYVFNGKKTGSNLSIRAIQYNIKQAAKKAGLEKPAHVHALRHSYATHLLEEGVNILIVKDLLGHESVLTTMVYLHVARFEQKMAHSPLDSLYDWNK